MGTKTEKISWRSNRAPLAQSNRFQNVSQISMINQQMNNQQMPKQSQPKQTIQQNQINDNKPNALPKQPIINGRATKVSKVSKSNVPKTNIQPQQPTGFIGSGLGLPTVTLSKAQKRKLRMMRRKNGIKSEKMQKEVNKKTHAIMTTYTTPTPSISAETPYQTPMQAPVQNNYHIPPIKQLNDTNETKLSKAQKRRLRMQKRKNNVNEIRVQSKPKQKTVTSQSRPSNLKPPLRNRNSIMPTVEKNDEKLSKAQKRKRRKKKMNGCL